MADEKEDEISFKTGDGADSAPGAGPEKKDDEVPQTGASIDLDSLSDYKEADKIEQPNLNDEEVSISDVKLNTILREQKTRDGTRTKRDVQTRIYFTSNKIKDELKLDGKVFSSYAGISQFKNTNEETGETTWSEPLLQNPKYEGDTIVSGKRQLSLLKKVYCDFKGINVGDVSLKEFLKGMVGCKAKLEYKTVSFDGTDFKKNMITEFL